MPDTLTPTGSLTALMDALYELETTVHDDLVVYRWRPTNFPQLDGGAIYNWLAPSPFEVTSTATARDNIVIVARVGIRNTDVNEQTAMLETYGDAFRSVIDYELWSNQPLNNAAKRVTRTGMRAVADRFNNIPVLAIEFSITCQLDRLIPAH